MEPIIEKVEEYFSKYSQSIYPILIFSFFLLGSFSVMFGVVFSQKNHVQAKTEVLPQLSIPQNKEAPELKSIMVDISGAVQNPGLYELKEGDRMAVVIDKSGGFDKRVHKSYVSRSLNLSQKLKDEEKIYIPFQGESVSPVAQQTKASVAASKKTVINVNTASSAELEQLSGIGEVRAEKIISGRPYKTAQELLSKKIVTQKIFEDIKDKLSF